jgi:hypothetical protein
MVPARFTVKRGVVFLLFCLAAGGCGRQAAKPLDAAAYQLHLIGGAYHLATLSLDYAPKSKNELLPFLQSEENTNESRTTPKPPDVFLSPNDGEEFVIHWGLDLRGVNLAGHPSTLPVLAYERHGKDGKRCVLQHVRHVTKVTDDEFAKLPFPPGYKAPTNE